MHGLEFCYNGRQDNWQNLNKVYRLNNNIISMFISDDFDDRTVILYEKYLGIKMCQIGNFHKAQEKNI